MRTDRSAYQRPRLRPPEDPREGALGDDRGALPFTDDPPRDGALYERCCGAEPLPRGADDGEPTRPLLGRVAPRELGATPRDLCPPPPRGISATPRLLGAVPRAVDLTRGVFALPRVELRGVAFTCPAERPPIDVLTRVPRGESMAPLERPDAKVDPIRAPVFDRPFAFAGRDNDFCTSFEAMRSDPSRRDATPRIVVSVDASDLYLALNFSGDE